MLKVQIKKEILYISDKGTIIYKDTQVVNDQGALGQTSLMVSKLDKSKDGDVHGVITEVESSLANVYIYSAKIRLYIIQPVMCCIHLIMIKMRRKRKYLKMQKYLCTYK